MHNNKELIEKIEDLEGSIKAFRALLTLITLELGWSNQHIRIYLRVPEEHLNFLRTIQ